jgi:glycerophosphoryl diester phosphodiesterase
MVKFGGHVEAIREGDLIDSNLYLIPYNEMKSLIYEINSNNTNKNSGGASIVFPPAVGGMTNGNGHGNGNGNGHAATTPAEEETKNNSDDNETKTYNESDEDFFIRIWKEALVDAEEDFRKAREDIWQTIFEGISTASNNNNNNNNDDNDNPLVRGAHPGNAIKLYVDLSLSPDPNNNNNNNSNGDNNNNKAQELLVRMKQVYRAASINSEGLRKIVKKADKNHSKSKNGKNGNGKLLSITLLPLLYTSSLYTGQNMIQDGIGLLRDLLSEDHGGIGNYNDESQNGMTGGGRDSNGDIMHNHQHELHTYNDCNFNPLVKHDSESRHQISTDIRMQEVEWLKHLVTSIPRYDLLPKLVAHRGFHHTKDRYDKRPVENSLSAYEIAWTSGIELCECDIALTKDEKLVLAHDENFERLSLDTRSDNSKKRIGDLTFKELISMPLTSGVRPPLLIDVLRSASVISEKSKLIIEIKPGNEVSAFALARLLLRHPDLRSCVAMIMSFDAATMHHLRAELDRATAIALPPPDNSRPFVNGGGGGGGGIDNSINTNTNNHRRVTSYDHFGTMSSGWLAGMGMGGGTGGLSSSSPSNAQTTHPSMDLSSIGLSISQTNFNSNTNLYDAPTLHHSMPKLMLLTVADPPKIACELQVQYNELHRVDPWLTADDGMLDGVYLQYQEEMLTPEGAAYLRQLSQRFLVGIWNYAEKDPDDFKTFEVCVLFRFCVCSLPTID